MTKATPRKRPVGSQSDMPRTPLLETIDLSLTHTVSRSLFALVNRSLNYLGLRSLITRIEGDLIFFKVENDDEDVGHR